MEKSTDSAYKPRARKVPGGESVEAPQDGKGHEPIKLREIVEDVPRPPRWVLTDSGWEMQ